MLPNRNEGVSENRGEVTIPWWALIAPLFLGLLVGGCGVAAFTDSRTPGLARIGHWISHFLTSSGFGGLCALVAAGIAYRSLTRQLNQAKLQLKHQQSEDANKSWWDRLEWTASRALPESRDSVPLPYALALDTLTLLSSSASVEIQKRTALGLANAVAVKERESAELVSTSKTASARSEVDEARPFTQDLEALRSYVQQVGKDAAPSVIQYQLYEREVINALSEALPDTTVEGGFLSRGSSRGVMMADAVIHLNGQNFVVEIKAPSTARAAARAAERAVAMLEPCIEPSGFDGLIIVLPRFDDSWRPPAHSASTAFVRWNPSDGAAALGKQVEAATKSPSS